MVYAMMVFLCRTWYMILILITLYWSIGFGQTSLGITSIPTLNAIYLEDIGECASTRCLNGSTCIDRFSSPCLWLAPYPWLTDINECAPTPCLNGGTCRDGINQFTCDCVSGYTGSRCQFDTVIEVNNITVPVCPQKHLCKSIGCSEGDQITQKFCHCDKACTFFDDCCVDYEDECSHDQHGEFQNMLKSRDLVTTDRQCVTVEERVIDPDVIIVSNDSYWMVSRCSKNLGVVGKKCQEPVCNDTLSTVPVIDSFGITYRNVYCAVCHNVRTSELTAWETTLDCAYLPIDLNGINMNFLCSACRLTLNPPVAARKCEPRMLSGCVSEADEAFKGGCEAYTGMIDVSGRIYKNPHCSLCSVNNKDITFDEYNVNCTGTHIPMYIVPLPESDGSSPIILATTPPNPPRPGGLPLSVVLNFASSVEGSSIKILRNTEIIIETTITCPEGEVYVEHRDASWNCIPLSCDVGFELHDGKCLPKTSDLPCGTDELNNTSITVTVTLYTEACKDFWFINVSEEFCYPYWVWIC
ncbi:uncharacterized protein [Amphiura filiformis]|uniref:uncharacterized protein n=1 Tax=Amphiura filiformis TaxID=82378 RepID=UPI003B223802